MPKPLVPVGDRPVLAHVVAQLQRGGAGRVVINTHYQAAHFRSLPAIFDVIHEPAILGTAGGVANAASALGAGDVVIWNGDILAPGLDVAALSARQQASSGGTDGGTWLWVVEPLAVGMGTVGLGARGEIVRLRGERFGREVRGGDYLGVQVMPPGVRRELPPRGCLVADVALPHLRRGGTIAAFPFAGPWDDVGDPAGLLRANLRWLDARGVTSWCAPDAEIALEAGLSRVVVGAGASVTGSGMVRESVIFPGATATAPLDRALVSPLHQVAVPLPLPPDQGK